MSDSDKSIDILIRTKADLGGAQATLAALEKQIDATKTLGKETAALEASHAQASATTAEEGNYQSPPEPQNQSGPASAEDDNSRLADFESGSVTAGKTGSSPPGRAIREPNQVDRNAGQSQPAENSDDASGLGIAKPSTHRPVRPWQMGDFPATGATGATDTRLPSANDTTEDEPRDDGSDKPGLATDEPGANSPRPPADPKYLREAADAQRQLLQQFETWAQTQVEILRGILNAMATLGGTQAIFEQKLKAVMDDQAKLNARLRDRQNF